MVWFFNIDSTFVVLVLKNSFVLFLPSILSCLLLSSHETATQLQEATALAEGRAAHSDNVIKQLQSQIANSDYFVMHSNDTEGKCTGILFAISVRYFSLFVQICLT